ncbi:MAG: diphthine--ammonia ligase [candidate division WOR-3 bacterium]
MNNKIVFSFSGGKDSCLSIYKAVKNNYEIFSLLTTITEGYDRVSIHGVRRELVIKQAQSLGFPIKLIYIPDSCTNEKYEKIMYENMLFFKNLGIEYVGFGDIFLEDIRAYREKNLSKLNMKGYFPLWKLNTMDLIKEFIELGFKAIVVCVDLKVLDISFLGKEINEEFVKEIENKIDVCGENGEFHTFVYDGPIFKEKILFERGDIVIRGDYGYLDLYPI